MNGEFLWYLSGRDSLWFLQFMSCVFTCAVQLRLLNELPIGCSFSLAGYCDDHSRNFATQISRKFNSTQTLSIVLFRWYCQRVLRQSPESMALWNLTVWPLYSCEEFFAVRMLERPHNCQALLIGRLIKIPLAS